jgi:hypothetical protein
MSRLGHLSSSNHSPGLIRLLNKTIRNCLIKFTVPFKQVPNNFHTNRIQNSNQNDTHSYYRHEIINKLQKEYSLISMITANLSDYYEKIRIDVSSRLKRSVACLQSDPYRFLSLLKTAKSHWMPKHSCQMVVSATQLKYKNV